MALSVVFQCSAFSVCSCVVLCALGGAGLGAGVHVWACINTASTASPEIRTGPSAQPPGPPTCEVPGTAVVGENATVTLQRHAKHTRQPAAQPAAVEVSRQAHLRSKRWERAEKMAGRAWTVSHMQ